MTDKKKTTKSFFVTLQEKYPSMLVAYSNKDNKVLAFAKDAKTLLKKLKEKDKLQEDIVFTGPIPKIGRTYVYSQVSLQNKRSK